MTEFVQNFGTSFVRALAISQKSAAGDGGDGVGSLISGKGFGVWGLGFFFFVFFASMDSAPKIT